MVRRKATVKIKGKPSIPFEYDRPEKWEEVQQAYDNAITDGMLSDKVSMVTLFNYGLDLKIRAKIQAANTDEGTKTKDRSRTQLWVLSNPAGADFRQDLIELMAPTGGKVFDAKALNKYLDELYAEEAAQIDA